MIATIELPNGKQEINFIVELLKRLNIRITFEETLDDEVIQEHAVILRERREAMQQADAQFFTWEEAETILANRKIKT